MTIKIWDILAGPILISDSDDPDEYPEECQELLICKAEVDGKIDLVVLWDVEDVLFVLHVHGNELVANFGCMLGVVHEAELLGLDVNFKDWVAFKSDAFTFDFLSPTVLVEAFSEKDYVGQHGLVISLVDAVRHPVQI